MRTRRSYWRTARAAALVLLAAPAIAAADAQPNGRTPAARVTTSPALTRVAQVEHDARTNATFATGVTPDGSATLVVEAGELIFRKTVSPAGRVVVQLERGKEIVTFTADADAVQITSGRHSVRLDPKTAGEAEYGRAKVFLANSKAVRLFRNLAAALEAGDEAKDTPAMGGLLMSGALVAMLDGDVGAPGRVAKRLASKHQKTQRLVSRVVGCYPQYESAVWAAWVDLWACYDSVGILYYRGCEYRWFLWIESAWFSFISCSAFSTMF